uniref:Uncharacterized protein LOC114329186 n=1 Tax=Diabrotica virgifera virgifera TaxID=50390 RepID=A0A6P7FDB8_DIAVI
MRFLELYLTGKGKLKFDAILTQAEEAFAVLNNNCSDIEDNEDRDYEGLIYQHQMRMVALEKEEIPQQKTKKVKKQKIIGRMEKLYLRMVPSIFHVKVILVMMKVIV